MSRKADSGSARGFDDIIGAILLFAALFLLMAQLSFDSHDITFLYNPPMRPAHNWIGLIGAYVAWWVFALLGVVAYVLPLLLAMFGAAYLLGFLGYLTYGNSAHYQWGFSLLGPIGATILYAAIGLVSLVFLTAFPLGDWLR